MTGEHKLIRAAREAVKTVLCEHDFEDMKTDTKDPKKYDKKGCRKCKSIFYFLKKECGPDGKAASC